MPSTLVTLTTDFGLADSYVAEVKAVFLGAESSVPLVDITHQIPAFDVRAGAFCLMRAYRHFPKGTWHLAVVDPGVGSARRAIHVRTRDYHFVGPDNGVLKWAVEDCAKHDGAAGEVRELTAPTQPSTFHGRDVFAPYIVSQWKSGAEPASTPGYLLEGASFPTPRLEGSEWVGSIVAEDIYGNLISCIPWSGMGNVSAVVGHSGTLQSSKSYSDIVPRQAALIKGSHGFWEIAVREGSAAYMLGVKRGDTVRIRPVG